MKLSAHPHVLSLVAYEPGKPVEDLAREMGIPPSQIIKLASNENPLGPSPKALAAMHDALARCHFYPDGGGWALRSAIAEKFQLTLDNIILGNGSNEIIELIGHAFLKPGDEIITAKHAFAVYSLMAQLFGAKTIEVDDPGFVFDLDATLAAISPQTKQIFIANPNNPTGTIVPKHSLLQFIEKLPDHVLLIFDEAYIEFLDDPPDLLPYIRQGRNIILMRTFSKIQGLAGLRIGYGIAPAHLARILQKTRQPFNANAIAQAGALASLHDDEHVSHTRQITREGRQMLQNSLKQMGLEFVPSHANFVLIRVGQADAVFKHLLKKGIIIRSMTSYKLPEWIRVSIGTMEQNIRFLQELPEALKTAWDS